jgi:hypothetical protein
MAGVLLAGEVVKHRWSSSRNAKTTSVTKQAPAELIDADDAVDRQIRSAVCLSIGGAKAAS